MFRLLLALVFGTPLFALISIVPVEMGEDVGVSVEAGASLSTKRGNSDTDSYKASARIAYDSNTTYVTWMQISGEYGEANDEKNVQKIYAHLRYIYNITDRYNVAEAFVQSQEDEFRLIQKRRLLGGGYRVHLLRDFFPMKFFIGFGGMYEYITYLSANNPNENNFRLNTYLAFTYPFKEDLRISFTSYYQPKVDEFSDFVTANKFELQFKIIEHLFLNFRISYDYDAQPAIEVKKYDFYQDTAFIYKF